MLKLFTQMIIPLLIILPAIAQPGSSGQRLSNKAQISLSVGEHNLIRSLQENSDLKYNPDKKYKNVLVNTGLQIGQRAYFVSRLQISDLPANIVGTKHSRPDYPLSTGRIQESALFVDVNKFSLKIGRTNFFEEIKTYSELFTRIAGDGLSLEYTTEKWATKYIIEGLPAEKSDDIVFRRILTYHDVRYIWYNLGIVIGEYFILTGPTIGLDIKRLNPFVPFSRNSHDSYRNFYDGFVGDSDNTIIKLASDWEMKDFLVSIGFYIDEFQVDKKDREIYNDALLLSLSWERLFTSTKNLLRLSSIEGFLSWSNPNFGDHPGPFTYAGVSSYPLLQNSPGATTQFFSKMIFDENEIGSFSFSLFYERWVNLSILAPDSRNIRSELASLPSESDIRYYFSYESVFSKINVSTNFVFFKASTKQNFEVGWQIAFIYTLSK